MAESGSQTGTVDYLDLLKRKAYVHTYTRSLGEVRVCLQHDSTQVTCCLVRPIAHTGTCSAQTHHSLDTAEADVVQGWAAVSAFWLRKAALAAASSQLTGRLGASSVWSMTWWRYDAIKCTQ